MAARGPILLFIGRESNGDATWRQVRHLCLPARALRASDAYRGMALLLKHTGFRVVIVAVDQLTDSEMSFFSAARRHRPDLSLLAIGEGNELSNPRLAQATWQGAQEIVTAEQLDSKLTELIGSESAAAESSGPQSLAPRGKVDRDVSAFLKSRSVAESKRKAPASKPSKNLPLPQSQDIVTPQELRVLLGEDPGPSDMPKESKK